MKKILLIILLSFTSVAFAKNGKEKKKHKVSAEFQAACSSDIERAGCSGKEDGGELMKCLHSYKKAHVDFQISEGCKSVNMNSSSAKKDKKDKKNK